MPKSPGPSGTFLVFPNPQNHTVIMKKKHFLPLLLLATALGATAQTETQTAAGTATGSTATTGSATAATGSTASARSHAATQQTYVFRYGYVNTDSVLHAMPQYAQALKNMDNLRQKYDKEMKRAEDDFNSKYEDFLDAQRDLVPSILQKRQAELQDMMDKNMAFKAEAKRLLAQAEHDALAPLRGQMQAAVELVAQKMQLAFVLDTASGACPYVNPAMSVDITATVMDIMNRKK